MKSTVEQVNPTRVKLTVEVPFDELKPHFARAYSTLAGQVRIPGFRPGKVPARILDARLGRGAILSEVVNAAVPDKYGEAVTAENLNVLGQPDIEITNIEDGQSVAFTAEVDVRPEITLPDPSTIAVTVDDVSVADSDIDEQVDALRERFATTTPVERAAEQGDLVTIDLRAAIDGEDLADATADGLTYRIGSGELVAGIDDALVGMSAGDVSEFDSALVAGEHAGEQAQITVALTQVAERELPAADDEFAQLASEFDTMTVLREDLAEKIRRVKNLGQAAQARDKVLEALLAATDIALPQGVVDAEVAARQHDAVHTFDHDEAALDAHLASLGQSREELDADIQESARTAVRTQLLLDALADANQVGVTQDEFTERLIYNAQRFGLSPDDYFRRMQEAGQLPSVFAEVRRGKALAGAVQQATVTDGSGNALDVNQLFGIEQVEETEAEVPDATALVGDGDELPVEAAPADDTDATGGGTAEPEDDDGKESEDAEDPADPEDTGEAE